MTPKAYIQHDLPGRLRVYIPTHKGLDKFFIQLHIKLGECDAIDGVHVNAITGSVLIYYRGEKLVIADFLSRNNLFLLKQKKQHHQKKHHMPLKRMSNFIEMLEQKIIQKSDNNFDLNFLTVGGLACLALFQAINGEALPPAWMLLSQAISTIRQYHRED